MTSATLNTNATLNGRVLASDGAVTLDSNTIIRPTCGTGGGTGGGSGGGGKIPKGHPHTGPGGAL